MSRAFGPRRAEWITLTEPEELGIPDRVLESFETYDHLYRTLTAVLYNFAQSGHPGGSVSAGHIMTAILFDSMEYDIGDPLRPDADLLSFAAGHKATGLYAMWGLRDEVTRVARPDLLPEKVNHRLRFEDLLGFRRNPSTTTPLFTKFGSKPLDGHPTPATPFVRIATGPSGVGVGSSLGLAFTLADRYGKDSPRVHLLEGEGGLTPGRVYETVASASASGLSNAICHLDWNQASIDSDRVTREGDQWGDYVQWDPMEYFYLHDWNVIEVPDGFDFRLVLTAQRMALEMDNGQPTAVVYRTEKGWRYGITGKKSHGGGHGLCSDEYYALLEPVLRVDGEPLPGRPGGKGPACGPDLDEEGREACHWATMERFRELLETEYRQVCEDMADRLVRARDRLDERDRQPRDGVPDAERVYAVSDPDTTPDELLVEPGGKVALRKQLGKVLGHLNKASGGAFLYGAADLLDSTAVSGTGSGFPEGYWHFRDNPGSRALSVGGICEDGLSCLLSGVSAFGFNVGVGASYGAFISPLGHIPARVHAISSQMRREVEGQETPYHPFVLLCGHASMKTGEDGPTHADPQAYQLHMENYVPGTAVTLTPWEPNEVWPAMAAAFRARPAVIVPFVTRPGEPVLDREALGLAPPEQAAQGVYKLVAAEGDRDGTLVLQGSAVTYEFVQTALPGLREAGIELDVYYVTSPELFDRLSPEEQDAIYPREQAHEAMGVTDFTLPTLYRWIRSDLGMRHTMHPFQKGHYLGSGEGHHVVHEAGMDGDDQLEAVKAYVAALAEARERGAVPA